MIACLAMLSACSHQSTPATTYTYVEDDPLRVTKSEGRARGYQFAVASQCGGVPARIAAEKASAKPGIDSMDITKVAAYRTAMQENFDRAMREERMPLSQCEGAKKDITMASLFPPPPDPSRMTARARKAYFADVEAKAAENTKREAELALQAQQREQAYLARQLAAQQAAAQCQYEVAVATSGYRPMGRGIAGAILAGLDQALTEQRLLAMCKQARGAY